MSDMEGQSGQHLRLPHAVLRCEGAFAVVVVGGLLYGLERRPPTLTPRGPLSMTPDRSIHQHTVSLVFPVLPTYRPEP